MDAKPRDYDFYKGCGEDWDYWEAARCDKCNKVVLPPWGEYEHDDIEDTECDGYISTDGPMMNYCYPISLRDEPSEAARKIVDLPLCIVSFTDEDTDYLALTGGGMDFSWEICEAYMRLGQTPPLHFCSLPAMAGRGQNAHDRWIIAGCRASAKVSRNIAQGVLRALANLKR